MKKMVVIGFLGSILDASSPLPSRWGKWRPTVSLCQQEDLEIDRLELLIQPSFRKMSDIIAQDIGVVSPETVLRVHNMEIQNAWDFEEVFGALHDFARSYPFEPDHEEYLVHITTGTHVAQICLFLLTESRHIPARLIQSSPPSRRQLRHPRQRKTLDEELPAAGIGEYSIIDLDLSRYDRLASRFQHEQVEAASFLKSGIETRNSGFNSLIDQIEQVSINSRAPILLMGPTGAGKSHLARRIFDLKKSRRQVGGPFVEVNCATLRGDGAMSALFGHKRGAFTGALQDRPGLLLSANGGMVFLDEIGELGPDEQAMLLHAVEEKCFLPVGSDKEIKSDFQLIAGTNRDLSQAIRRGEFREDLLARLNLWTFRLPGLNERPEDIEPNLDYELDRFTRENGRRVTFNKEARNRFLKFATSSDAPWTANFRDLGAAVTRMATLASSGRIDAPLVDSEIERLSLSWGKSQSGHRDRQDWQELLPPELLSVAGNGPSQAIDKFDQVQLLEVLRQCRRARTISEAGRLLFGTSRTEKTKANDADRLRKYLARFELDWRLLREFWDNRPM